MRREAEILGRHPASPVKPSEKLDASILLSLSKYLWPADKPEYKLRVAGAVGLLISSKVINVQVG